MKRKALITATAVLLVAVMCLATASYAWFTSGTANQVSNLKLYISAEEGGLQLATADLKGKSYVAGPFSTKAITLADIKSTGIVPSDMTQDENGNWTGNGTLVPVSTDCVAVNGDYDFYPAEYDGVSNWTTQSEAVSGSEGYVLFSFYARAATAGSADLKITLDTDSNNFKAATKVAYDVTSVTFNSSNAPTDLSVLNGFGEVDGDGKFVPSVYTFADTETYNGCNDAGAVSTKNAARKFVPVTAGDTKFTADITDKTWADQTISFTANEVKLFTVAIWVEGMDKDCSGAWTATCPVTVSLANWQGAAA